MKRPDKSLLGGLSVLAALVVLAGCSTSQSGADRAAVEPARPSTTLSASTEVAPVLVAPERGQELVAAGAVLVDVRTPAEFADAHIAGAVLIDVTAPDFEERIAALDASVPHVVYCRTGNRSAAAAARMVEAGFTEVYDAGGIEAWIASGLPVVTD